MSHFLNKICSNEALKSKTGTFAIFLTAAFFGFFAVDTSAEEKPSKAGYHLFNPTPKNLMRELNTDRPDKTESPYTVDAGHFQVETDIVTHIQDNLFDGVASNETRTFGIMASNLKLGITNWMDLQLIVTPFQTEQTVSTTGTENKMGFGDTTVRIKFNLFNNDGGDVALGLMPFAKFPTHSGTIGNSFVEGGLIVPLAVSLPGNWDLGLMVQINLNKNESNNLYHPEFVSTYTLGHDIVGELGGYIEFFSLSSLETGSEWNSTLDFGLTYKITPNVQLDAGINIGLTPAADDLNPFLGISARI